jgi:hypothetical protein
MTDEHIPDRFELAMRRWTAQEKLVDQAHEFAQIVDLDPELIVAVEEARREDDALALIEAVTKVWRAAREAQGLV